MAEEKKPVIFILDDDSFLLDMYTIKFKQAEYEVMSALDPSVALQKMRDGLVPDVLLMDVVMPHMTGFELVEALKKENLATSTVKIFLSNTAEKDDIAKGESLGAAGYIIKANNTPSEVIAQVNEIFQKSKGQA